MSFLLSKGPYCGDISALCLISCPSVSGLRLLLAGTGPHLILYDLSTGKLLQSLFCFDGVRVHGICAIVHETHDGLGPEVLGPIATVAVHGEDRVKLFQLMSRKEDKWELQLHFLRSLPRLTHWVLDALFLQESCSGIKKLEDGDGDEDGELLLAIGLSDNSLSLWDIQVPALVYRVESTERCLLYSMRLWGTSVDTLRVAAGTIFNEVLIWKLGDEAVSGSKILSKSSRSRSHDNPGVMPATNASFKTDVISDKPVTPLHRLSGHEGSIHRISWSADGLWIISVSDDRSARVWKHRRNEHGVERRPILGDGDVEKGPVLYGHGSRVWDCHAAEQLLVTASEDCTCRVWAPDGRHLTTLRGHTGRGIWRCVYDLDTSTLVTAGADSAIRVASLRTWTNEKHSAGVDGLKESTEVFLISSLPTKSCSNGGLTSYIDSKSEYVRCVSLAGPLSLYVATNCGCLHRVHLPRNGKEHWTTYVNGYMEGPIVCMDVLSPLADKESLILDDDLSEHMVAVGNGQGQARVMKLQCTGLCSEINWNCSWQAEAERKLLGIFWCKSLGSRCVFTTNPRGRLQVWSLGYDSQPAGLVATLQDSSSVSESRLCVSLMASCQSPTQNQIMCLDVCLQRQVLVFGEKTGTLVVASFPSSLEPADQGAPVALVVLAVLKGAHGISGVTSILTVPDSLSAGSEIISTGKDGCICKFMSDNSSSWQGLVCTGVEKVPVITNVNSLKVTGRRRIAAGFTADDFIVWDLLQQSELMRVPCGGWRRPFSYLNGGSSESQNCLAFLKDHVIHIHRKWNSSSLSAGKKNCQPDPTSAQFCQELLHIQFHGKEIQSVQFIRGLAYSTITTQGLAHSSWVATGGEDGTVRLTRFARKPVQQIETSLVLGEHTGGSAVRALAVVSSTHLVSQHPEPHDGEMMIHPEKLTWTHEKSVLVSVGAKEVMTCWLLQWLLSDSSPLLEGGLGSSCSAAAKGIAKDYTSRTAPAIAAPSEGNLTCSWLTSYRPRKPQPLQGPLQVPESKVQHKVSTAETGDPDAGKFTQTMMLQEERGDDDLRYMAVTAFSTLCCNTGSSLIFVVTASSDSSLTLQAFSIASRSWLKVAMLKYHTAPVLALTHLVVQSSHSVSGGLSKLFLVFSGATDGCIAVWDVTAAVVKTLRDGYEDGPSRSISTSLRPLSGRGSQGGRRKRLGWHNGVEGTEVMSEVKTAAAHVEDVELVVKPIQIIPAAHMSGVNCLSVEKLQQGESIRCRKNGVEYILVSGGDDDALHAVTFSVESPGGEASRLENAGSYLNGDRIDTELKDLRIENTLHQECTVLIGCRALVACAHYSALKGVWTDGRFIFSTGLDQRLRCWVLTYPSSELPSNQFHADGGLLSIRECAHSVIDVPEAAALHVEHVENGSYRIAVAGRGLQILTFDQPPPPPGRAS